eukprot:gene7594-749_t
MDNDEAFQLAQSSQSVPLLRSTSSQYSKEKREAARRQLREKLISSDQPPELRSASSAALCQQLKTKDADVLRTCMVAMRPGMRDPSDTEEDELHVLSLRGRFVKCILADIRDDVDGTRAKALGKLILDELDYVTFKDNTEVISAVVSAVEDASHALPVLLGLIGKAVTLALQFSSDATDEVDEAEEEGVASVHAGSAHRDSALLRITSATWQPDQISQILIALRDTPMTTEQLRRVVQCTARSCLDVELQLLPPILYNLLLMSSLGLKVEGAVLVHIGTIIKYDHSLGKDWLKSFKGVNSSVAPTPFMLALMFSLLRHHQFEQTVLQLLKKIVVEAFDSEVQRRSNPWTSSLSHPLQMSGSKVYDVMQKAVRHGCGGDIVVPGIVRLATELMLPAPGVGIYSEAGAINGMLKLLQGFEAQGNTLAGAEGTPGAASAADAVRSTLLGIHLLGLTFMIHAEARGEILTIIQRQMVAAGGRLEKALPYVLLLGSLIKTQPAYLYDHMQQLKLKTMNSAAANTSGATMAALSQASTSQSAMSQMSALTSGPGVSAMHELMGFLRKALSQQAVVRQALYGGLYAVLVADPGSLEPTADLLLPQFARFFDIDPEAATPLRLEACINTQGDNSVVLLEPLPDLLDCVRRLSALASSRASEATMEEDEDAFPVPGPGNAIPQSAKVLIEQYNNVKSCLLQCEAESFNLDKSCVFNPSCVVGASNQLRVSCLLGCLEVVMEDVVGEASGDEAVVKSTGIALARLFDLHHRLCALARDTKIGKPTNAEKENSQRGSLCSNGGDVPMTSEGDRGAARRGATAAGSQKRSRELCPDLVPVDSRQPMLSFMCLSKLPFPTFMLLTLRPSIAMQPYNVEHSRLSRQPTFHAFVLRACINKLASCRSASALSEALAGAAPPVDDTWGVLAPPLFRMCYTLLMSWTGRPGGSKASGSRPPKGRMGRSEGGSSPSSETRLAEMAVDCMKTLFESARSLEGLATVFSNLPLPNGEEDVHVEGEVEGRRDNPAYLPGLLKRLPCLNATLTQLMGTSSFKEAQALCECITELGHMLPQQASALISKWALEACQQTMPEVSHPGVVRALVAMHVCTLTAPKDKAALKMMAEEVQLSVGGPESQTSQGVSLSCLNSKTDQQAAVAILRVCEASMKEVEGVIKSISQVVPEHYQGSAAQAKAARRKLEAAACTRMDQVSEVLSTIVNARLGVPSILDMQNAVLTQAYKILSSLAKLMHPSKGESAGPTVRMEFLKLVGTIHKDLTPPIYSCITDAQETSVAQPLSDRQAQAKMKKELRIIPELIHKVVNVNFMSGARRSTNRDFKLIVDPPPEANTEQQDDGNAPDEAEEAEEEEEEAAVEEEEDEEEQDGMGNEAGGSGSEAV